MNRLRCFFSRLLPSVRDLSSFFIAACFAAILLAAPSVAEAQYEDPCIVADNGSGTVILPPEGCAYLSPAEVHMIVDGLPPGTTIELSPIHLGFFCAGTGTAGPCTVEPGGNLGGQRELFDSFAVFQAIGTGELAGFDRLLHLQLAAETHTAPRTPGDPVQVFDTDFFLLQGALFGDPDFGSLQITGGTGLGFPSPGSTTLTELPDGDFAVDSFFDISYQIAFEGAPGGALSGLSGSTAGTVRMEARGNDDPCVASDNGSGSVDLPPTACNYFTPTVAPAQIIDGLPNGTTLEIAVRHADFVCIDPVSGKPKPSAGLGVDCGAPGGVLGGEVEQFDSNLILQIAGTGALADFRRTMRLPAAVETHSGPRAPGSPVQVFDMRMIALQGTLTGDPDFADLTVTAGDGNGLPSPGSTTLTELPGGDFQVDSFFDITYQIDFEGADGGALEGLSGSTTLQKRVRAKPRKRDDFEPDDGSGTAVMPPLAGQYVSVDEVHEIIDGLPPGTSIELSPTHRSFFCDPPNPCSQPGGNLGGDREVFTSVVDFELRGTGALTGFQRTLQIPLAVETHTGPRGAAAVQSFDTDMFSLQGSLFGDPDFDQLIITGGTDNKMPSPGHTTLTRQPGGDFLVDSFFDISYQIDFVGAKGGALDGLSGSTRNTVRMTACEDPNPIGRGTIIIRKDAVPNGATDFSFTGLGTFFLDDDADATLPDFVQVGNAPAGTYPIQESALPPGWTLTGIECEDPDMGTTVDLLNRTANIDLDAGETVTCKFTNEFEPVIFRDGFESGDTSAWSNQVP